MWKEFQLINSFTLESSFCGPTRGAYKDCHFTIKHLREMGRLFCVTLKDYASNETKVRQAIMELEQMFPPMKAEEGLSQQFNNMDRNGNIFPDDSEDKRAKKKKTPGTKGVSGTKDAKGRSTEVPPTSSKQTREEGKKKTKEKEKPAKKQKN